jgi:hypothetical protein
VGEQCGGSGAGGLCPMASGLAQRLAVIPSLSEVVEDVGVVEANPKHLAAGPLPPTPSLKGRGRIFCAGDQ